MDDTATSAIRLLARSAAADLVLAAYVVFGFPEEDRRPPCINPTKWKAVATWFSRYLGFDLDSRRMLVIWPLDKRRLLILIIDTKWLLASGERPWATPRDIAQLLGTVRHSSFVSAWGPFLSIRIQHFLNAMLPKHRRGPRAKRDRWWDTHKALAPVVTLDDVRLLRESLDDDDVYNPAWCRSIGLLIAVFSRRILNGAYPTQILSRAGSQKHTTTPVCKSRIQATPTRAGPTSTFWSSSPFS